MAFRDLVMGGGGCSAPGMRPSGSNPLSSLADSLLGSAAKNQERVRDLPGFARENGEGSSSSAAFRPGPTGPFLAGAEFQQDGQRGMEGDAFAREFMDSFHGMGDAAPGMDAAWAEARGMPGGPMGMHGGPQMQPDFARPDGPARLDGMRGEMFGPGSDELMRIGPNGGMQHMPSGPRDQMLGQALHTFFEPGLSEGPMPPGMALGLTLSPMDKMRIRDRSCILGRHVFAEKGEPFVQAQVSSLLKSLDIEDGPRMLGPMGGRFSEFEDYWTDVNGAGAKERHAIAGGWAGEFQAEEARRGVPGWMPEGARGMADGWAGEFQAQQANGGAWADEFNQAWNQQSSVLVQGGMPEHLRQMEARAQSRQLADALAQDANPKMQQSKFLQFVSKMSRGELIVEDSGVKAGPPGGALEDGQAQDWASEFERMNLRSEAEPEKWAEEFATTQMEPGSWAQQFVQGHMGEPSAEQWADEFQSGWTGRGQSAERGIGDSSDDAGGWLDSYNKFVEEQMRGDAAMPGSQGWLYEFADQNPYVGQADAFNQGHGLFRKGLLSEAVLALEAEVLKNPDHAEAWRLLGIAHAENDDDRQAISAMVRARDADPTNLEVLLALGVSHTNELEQTEALSYLRGWLQHHPKYGASVSAAPPEALERLTHAEVARLFTEASQASPADADLHTVLGVLFNLSREYDRAIESFRRALSLQPQDYSLWNKLGATQANSTQSSEAIDAYQKALDLKPNYVRAWSNMGIGYANQGRYEESLPFYVRALAMNPRAENAWQYLRISLSCAGHAELLGACDRHDLEALKTAFPM
eukprot:TRINITY_DN1411_c0_g1_i3.p1 TRINITY_DN1411_c0_g1~~TRINITY_DN1411_c0_g1_i3.p1  ORF type:complete len:809 (+),score=186.04 TRINITY_DN1411_c0_g1_i3:731-3157(+)